MSLNEKEKKALREKRLTVPGVDLLTYWRATVPGVDLLKAISARPGNASLGIGLATKVVTV